MVHILYETLQLAFIAGTLWYTRQLAYNSDAPSKQDVSAYVTRRIEDAAYSDRKKLAKELMKEQDDRFEALKDHMNNRVNATLTALVKRIIELENK